MTTDLFDVKVHCQIFFADVLLNHFFRFWEMNQIVENMFKSEAISLNFK